jgi:hypothetical protein
MMNAVSPGNTSSQGGCQLLAGDLHAPTPWAALVGLLFALGGRARHGANPRRGS